MTPDISVVEVRTRVGQPAVWVPLCVCVRVHVSVREREMHAGGQE